MAITVPSVGVTTESNTHKLGHVYSEKYSGVSSLGYVYSEKYSDFLSLGHVYSENTVVSYH